MSLLNSARARLLPSFSERALFLSSLDRSQRKVMWILALLTMVRFLLAGSTDLSEDEAYYWLWSTHLALGYYDHPPMVAYWIKAGTALFGDNAFGVRFFFIGSTLAATYWLGRASLSLFTDRAAAFLVALWFNAMLVTNTFAIVATPDTPLLVFSALALFALAKLVEAQDGRFWLLAGFALGAAFVSKYTAGLLLPGLFIWMVATPFGRRWFLSPYPYLGALIAALTIAPVVYWNMTHEWVSFLKQIEHSVKDKPQSAVLSFFEFAGGQAGIVTPVIFGFIVCAAWAALIRATKGKDASLALPCLLFWPGFFYFAVHSFSQKIQPNWPVFLYTAGLVAAVPSASLFWVRAARPRLRRLFDLAAPVGLALSLVAFLQLGFGLFPLPEKLDPMAKLKGWSSLGAALENVRAQEGAVEILTDRYATTGEFAFTTKRPRHVAQVSQRIRYTDFPAPDEAALRRAPALFVVQSGHGTDAVAPYFDNLRLVTKLKRNSGLLPKDNYDVVLLSGYRGGLFRHASEGR